MGVRQRLGVVSSLCFPQVLACLELSHRGDLLTYYASFAVHGSIFLCRNEGSLVRVQREVWHTNSLYQVVGLTVVALGILGFEDEVGRLGVFYICLEMICENCLLGCYESR